MRLEGKEERERERATAWKYENNPPGRKIMGVLKSYCKHANRGITVNFDSHVNFHTP